MRKNSVQMSLLDIYNDVSEAVENKKPKLIALLEEHIDFEKIIPYTFYRAFYSRFGRNHIFYLESFIRALLLQRILGIPTDKLLHFCALLHPQGAYFLFRRGAFLFFDAILDFIVAFSIGFLQSVNIFVLICKSYL